MGNNCTSPMEQCPLYGDKKALSVDLPLTIHDIELLKESWKTIQDQWSEIHIIAFTRWFTTYPDIAPLFHLSANSKEEIAELINSPALQGHADRFKLLVDKLLMQSEDIDKISKIITSYGVMHHGLGADQKYATYLGLSLKFAVCEVSKCDVVTANAWDSLFKFLAGSLKRGMRIAKAREESKSCSTTMLI